jgi:hypothetical protein
MKLYYFFISLVCAVILSVTLFAINIAASYAVIELLKAKLGTHLIFVHNNKNESPVLLAFLGLCAFPYSFIYTPISVFLMSIKAQKACRESFIKSFYENFKRKIVWQGLLGIVLWTLLFVTGAYIV